MGQAAVRGVDEFERAEQVAIDRSHALVCAHLVECPPCAVMPVDVELEAFEWLRYHGHTRTAVAGISAVCNSQKLTAYGYSWRFTDR